MMEHFDKLDENELAMVINQISRRMAVLRCTSPDIAFWHGVLMRVCKWLATEPVVNESEKKLLIDPPTNVSGRTRAVKNMRERSGMNMSTCMGIIDAFIHDNLDKVHATVRASYLSNDKNRRAHGIAQE